MAEVNKFPKETATEPAQNKLAKGKASHSSPDSVGTHHIARDATPSFLGDPLSPTLNKTLSSPPPEEEEKISSKDMGFGWKSPDMDEVEMDMTPMMDCSFLLLIFFVINATFAINEVKNIQVPKATYTQAAKQDLQTLTVSLTKDRKIYLGKDQNPVELKEVRNRLAKQVQNTSQQDVILTADHSLDYGFIVTVLDEVNGAGVKNVKLKLEKKKN